MQPVNTVLIKPHIHRRMKLDLCLSLCRKIKLYQRPQFKAQSSGNEEMIEENREIIQAQGKSHTFQNRTLTCGVTPSTDKWEDIE